MLNSVSIQSAAPFSPASGAAQSGSASEGSFFDLVNSALQNVSVAQNVSATAEAGYVAGAPGATIGRALVASDRAQVAWNATVAVRNEVVSAYQSIMNMQF
jgi:flagellar hook-basal body complex protein FliE